MRRYWLILWLTILTVGLGGTIARVAQEYELAKRFVPPHLLAAGVSPYAYYDNERGTGRYWVQDPQYGAKCDGATNDRTAIQAADAAAIAVGGEVDFPAAVCGVGSPAKPSPLARWVGRAGSTIRAIAPMTSGNASTQAVVEMSISTGSVATGFTPATLQYLTIDANRPNCPNCARYGIITDYDWLSTYDNLTIINGLTDLVHRSTHVLPANIGTVTCTGTCSTTLPIVSQPDTSYLGNFPVAPLTPASLVVKVLAGGALNTATLVLSQDGGATFATVSQLISGTTYLTQATTTQKNFWSGIAITFPAGTYTAGDKYAFTVQAAEQYAINAWTHWLNPILRYTGTAYASTNFDRNNAANTLGFSSPGVQNDAYLAPGTISTSGGNVVVGSGTTFISGADHGRVPRPGDFFAPTCAGASPTNVFQIAGVEDDTHLYAPNGTNLPTCAASNYIIWTGAAFFEVDGGDVNGGEFRQGAIENVANGMRLCGDGAGGMQLFGTHIESEYLGAGFSFGGLPGTTSDAARISVGIQAKSPVGGYGTPYYLQLTALETLQQPRLFIGNVYGPGNARVTIGGSDYIYAGGSLNGGSFSPAQYTVTPVQALMLPPTPVAVTVGNQVLPSPTTDLSTNNTSYLELTPNANYLGFSGTPIFTNPNAIGQVMTLHNSCASNHWLQFFDQSTTGFTKVYLQSEQISLAPCCEFDVRSATGGGSTNGRWQQVSPVTCSIEGPSGQGHANGTYPVYVQSTSATPVVVAEWDYTFSGFHGMAVRCDLFAEDTNTTDKCAFQDIEDVFNSDGTEFGTMTVGHVRGSNSGGCPSGWPTGSGPPAQPIGFQNNSVGGGPQRQLLFTGVAGHTIKVVGTCQDLAAPKQ